MTRVSSLFYLASRRAHRLLPKRISENPYWESTEQYTDDLYTIWDASPGIDNLFGHT